MARPRAWYSLRRRFLLLFVLLLAAGMYAQYRLRLAARDLPVGTGPAGPPVPGEAFATPWAERPVVLAGLGDSITRGFGVSRDMGYFDLLRANHDAIYPDMVGKDLSSVLPWLEAINLAQDYTTTQQHIDQQLPRLPIFGSEVFGIVVITAGGNDLIHDYGRNRPVDGAMYGCTYAQAQAWTENIKARLRTIIETVNGRFPGGCEIFLANIYDPTDGVGDPQIAGLPRWPDCVRVLNLTNRKITALCDEFANVHLVDIRADFMGHGFHCTDWWRKTYRRDDPGHWYHANIEDPNERGYDAIRRRFLVAMLDVLPARLARSIEE